MIALILAQCPLFVANLVHFQKARARLCTIKKNGGPLSNPRKLADNFSRIPRSDLSEKFDVFLTLSHCSVAV